MAVAARRVEGKQKTSRRESFTVVDGGRSRRRAPMNSATIRNLMWTTVAVILLFMLAGLGRVWMSSEATQASLDSQRLKGELAEATKKGDALEVEYAFNSRTERISAIAREAMAMGPAGEVSYMDLAPPVSEVVAEIPDTAFANKTVRADMGGFVDLVAGLFSSSESGERVVGGR